MAKMGRPGLSDRQKTELWLRWKKGETLTEIGLALGKHAGSIHGVLASNGGYFPPKRQRSPRSLVLSEREEISRGLARGESCRSIARRLRRSPSTVTREVRRNGGRHRYRATGADERAWDQARRPKPCKLAEFPRLNRVVADKLSKDWSPEQVAGWLSKRYPSDETMRVSHETIYRSLFIQARGVLKRELIKHLRSRRMMRRARVATRKGQPRGQIRNAVSIRERPSEASDRSVPGHWEGDLVVGTVTSQVATLVERRSRFTILVRTPSKDAATVARALRREIVKIPTSLRRSLTWDRGMELAYHEKLSVDTNVKIYFCDPQSPWQRGTNENTNRLLRQYFPRGEDLSKYSQSQLNQIANKLNQRPRKTLEYRCPADVFR